MILKERVDFLDFFSVLNAKICHDLISPIGALNNAIELIDEIGSDEEIFDLIKLSAKSSKDKIEFFRIIYGPVSKDTVDFNVEHIKKIFENFLSHKDIFLKFETLNLENVSASDVKLLGSFLCVLSNCLPRGGAITISVEPMKIKFFAVTELPIKIDVLSKLSTKIDFPNLTTKTVSMHYLNLLLESGSKILMFEAETLKLRGEIKSAKV